MGIFSDYFEQRVMQLEQFIEDHGLTVPKDEPIADVPSRPSLSLEDLALLNKIFTEEVNQCTSAFIENEHKEFYGHVLQ